MQPVKFSRGHRQPDSGGTGIEADFFSNALSGDVMLFGLSYFTVFHVFISLLAIGSGLIAACAYTNGRLPKFTTAFFLLMTLATNLTGFLFPFKGVTPAFTLGIISSVVFAISVLALYAFRLSGLWRAIYAVGALILLYLNVFVLVVQSFLKIPPLHALAPNGNEPVFFITQGVVFMLFLIGGYREVRRFHPA